MVAGTHLRTEAGWVELQEVFDTECYEPVYNLRVAEYHTYFVGAEEWESGVWAHNAACQPINVAFGTNTGLESFASTYNAKIFLQWTRNDFGLPSSYPWNPNDITGGVASPFAHAVRIAIEKSKMIYFKVNGFDVLQWNNKYLAAGPNFRENSITSWELYQLVLNNSYAYRHSAEDFVLGATQMTYEQFKAYAINILENAARQEKTSNPKWDTPGQYPNAIRSLLSLFEFTAEEIAAL